MPDGSVKHLHVVAHALVDEPQNLQFAGAIMDVTARKQAEEALRRSEQRYRHLFHHMPVALWQLNARGVLELFKRLRSEGVADLGAYFDAHPDLPQRCMEMLIIEEVNEHTVQMLGGRDTSEFVGTSIARYFPENSPTFRRSMVSRYRGDPNYAAETRLFALDGHVVDVLYTASRVGPTSEPGMSPARGDRHHRAQAGRGGNAPERTALQASVSQRAIRSLADRRATFGRGVEPAAGAGREGFVRLHR